MGRYGRSAAQLGPGGQSVIVYGRGRESGVVVAAFADRLPSTERGVECLDTWALPGLAAGRHRVVAGGSYLAIDNDSYEGEYFETLSLPRAETSYGHIWRRFSEASEQTGTQLLRALFPDFLCPLAGMGRSLALHADDRRRHMTLRTIAIVFDRQIEKAHGQSKAGIYVYASDGDAVHRYVIVPRYDRHERPEPLFVEGHPTGSLVDHFVVT